MPSMHFTISRRYLGLPASGASTILISLSGARRLSTKRAIVKPYYDAFCQSCRISPFGIEGCDAWMFQRQIQWPAGP